LNEVYYIDHIGTICKLQSQTRPKRGKKRRGTVQCTVHTGTLRHDIPELEEMGGGGGGDILNFIFPCLLWRSCSHFSSKLEPINIEKQTGKF
jgi:hypothetical protein